ncbi:Pfs, NACHT and Ankyrin domain protein [Fusarium austroafricanum]|uniref:Pfs, NACHT and Ankyrin domain protein n=1 Tax=Fusarium austroafricanum TaxID=2364996 RepID=A0A8H4K987_9HYPO|nr:Pfs, NACHT and Ankyrin domain protein [Fusarium austroafricanum]
MLVRQQGSTKTSIYQNWYNVAASDIPSQLSFQINLDPLANGLLRECQAMENLRETGSPHFHGRQNRIQDLQIPDSWTSQKASLAWSDRYTVAWICALHTELAAAQAILDEDHTIPFEANLPTLDSNTYTLGSIGHHDVVIACLPTTQYGTVNAANVIAHLIRTFTSVRFGLFVGIGGGAPGQADIRLGDIVVGTRVMQYDLGKAIGPDDFQRTATPRTCHQLFGTAITALRAKMEREENMISKAIRQEFERYPKYTHPELPDRLFIPNYSHPSTDDNCDDCDSTKLIFRSIRATKDPLIHYGGIASGNQVMRSATQRDQIAQQLNVLCFEMEAAGVMDALPCLPIRGICDYSDSHKNKDWQRYSAAAAAAYAKELLTIFPAAGTVLRAVLPEPVHIAPSFQEKHREKFIQSLWFDEMGNRENAIGDAQGETCRWFLEQPSYRSWLDPQNLDQHHGFLWIRGKPGAGKSTMMKFAYQNYRYMSRNTVVAKFFFNAHGEVLERTIEGMYRSLILQLLKGYSSLQCVLDDSIIDTESISGRPSLWILKRVLCSVILNLGNRAFTCFIDALDECDEQQTMDMVQYFEEVAEQAAGSHIPLRICFSSRHYPYIIVNRGIQLTLEDHPGHFQDLYDYVSRSLQIRDTVLCHKLARKASGVFLWVVLVVNILNKEYRHGGLALRRKVEEIPSGLSNLFRNILERGPENMEDFKLCILWILCAKRPLTPAELHHAIWSGLRHQDIVDQQLPYFNTQSQAEMCVISSSKGLAEIKKAKRPTVQFIHESVRDFLVQDRGLRELWPDLGLDWEIPSHETLKNCCNAYMDYVSMRSTTHQNSQPSLYKTFPFLSYACHEVLHHADVAARGRCQEGFLHSFFMHHQTTIIDCPRDHRPQYYTPRASLLYILASEDCPNLIRTVLQKSPNIDILGERHRYPLFAALIHRNRDSVAALLDAPSTVGVGVDVLERLNAMGSYYGKLSDHFKGHTPFSWAVAYNYVSLARLLLNKGADVNEHDSIGQSPIFLSSYGGHEAMTGLLIEKGADVNLRDTYKRSPLSWASMAGHTDVIYWAGRRFYGPC